MLSSKSPLILALYPRALLSTSLKAKFQTAAESVTLYEIPKGKRLLYRLVGWTVMTQFFVSVLMWPPFIYKSWKEKNRINLVHGVGLLVCSIIGQTLLTFLRKRTGISLSLAGNNFQVDSLNVFMFTKVSFSLLHNSLCRNTVLSFVFSCACFVL